ncbi:MAG: HlyD family efflux transporter periplasmic adaptor subunit [Alphaproteobacteria bacterium]|nr:HlyD family efflux transporter periplasmic adaptor subunit [Alphaproteobacteria bacterium]
MSERKTRPTWAEERPAPATGSAVPPHEQRGGLPAVIEQAPRRQRRWRPRIALIAVLLIVGAGAGLGWVWWRHHQMQLPPGIAYGNGRLEADSIDIDTKFAGRVASLFVDEGDLVQAGQVVAMMDTRDIRASLKKSEALVSQAQRAFEEAKANLVQQQTQVKLAQQELDRTGALVVKGFATVELLDQRRQQMNAAAAAENAATQKVAEAQHALDAATHDVELYRVYILDNTLIAPRDGPIEYRVANVREVLPAGGKVFTMLDASYVYMDIYLPTAEAGRIRIGSDARIVLDAYPDRVIPAKVVFIAAQAQFTPKTVETKQERDKLMFRIRVRIDPARLKGREAIVRSGLPGVAYVRTDPSGAWPPNLQPSLPPSVSIAVPP